MAELVTFRDAPGTQREFETIFIVAPESSTDQIHSINQRLRGVIEGAEGKLLRVENWGKRKLAYEIKNHVRGIYLYWRFLSPPKLVHEIERNLRMLDPVIRYLTIRVDENIDPSARPSDFDDEAFAAAATTIPDEEDIALGRVDRGSEQEEGQVAAAEDTAATSETPRREGQAEQASEEDQGEQAPEEDEGEQAPEEDASPAAEDAEPKEEE